MPPNEDNPHTSPTETLPPAHVSTFARVGLLMYTFLIVYASLYPFANWHSMGLPFWGFLFAPMPHYWTGFDVITNVIGYLPLGTLIVFALYPNVRGVSAAVLAVFGGMLLSGSMEAVQTYLPSRVSSNLDFLTNIAGTCIGAVVGVLLSPTFLTQSRLLQLRREWFLPEAGRGLIIAGLWPLAQIYPQGYLFGHGQIVPILSEWLSDWMETPIDLLGLLMRDVELNVQEYWLAETLITACGFTGALLTLSCVLRKHAPKAPLLLALAVASLATKSMANALLFAPANVLAWLTPGARGGLLVGAMMVTGLAYAPPPVQRRLAVTSLAFSFIVINLVPANPYFVATLQTWTQGKFLNFNGAAHFLSVFWPFLALWFLLHPAHRAKKAEAPSAPQ
ncbi:MAG TPA: VanZ family protein [Noviherbaspirillum sp.]|uniref:VanZ family protein n=1 Tax=Noviherbaspirillum sp. TaxID=1926288 RepID=UPI002B461DE2|nr:VanZ family protein [Noviherbaspirillum sp.]HJV87193.1 VanZ family protein [Noviherbaspirillum sp.]